MTLPTAMPVFPLRAATTEAAGPGNDVPASLHKGPQMFLQGIGCGKSQALSQPVSGLFHRIVADVLNPRYLPAALCAAAQTSLPAGATEAPAPASLKWNTPARDAGSMTSAATVTISSINNAGVDEVYAIGLVAEDGIAYPASASGGSYSVSVPQGKYTAIYLAKGNDAAHYYYGTIEDTQVSGDVTLTFDLSAFSHSIAVDRVNSEGEKLKWPVGGDTSNANIGSSYELSTAFVPARALPICRLCCW